MGIAARVALALARDARSRRMPRTNASHLCVVTSVARAATCLDLAPPTDEAELEWICGQAFVDAELADLEPRTMTRKLKAAAKRAAAPERLRRQSFAELDPLHGVADRAR